MESTIRFSTYPKTEKPPHHSEAVVDLFRRHEAAIATLSLEKGLTSNRVMAVLADGLASLGFEVETGKRMDQRINRPVFFGENGVPTLNYQIDAYQPNWKAGLEIEAGRAWMGNAVYRDLIQAAVMVDVDFLYLAVPNCYRYMSSGRPMMSRDYSNTCDVAEALFGHSRLRLPYRLVVIGY